MFPQILSIYFTNILKNFYLLCFFTKINLYTIFSSTILLYIDYIYIFTSNSFYISLISSLTYLKSNSRFSLSLSKLTYTTPYLFCVSFYTYLYIESIYFFIFIYISSSFLVRSTISSFINALINALVDSDF